MLGKYAPKNGEQYYCKYCDYTTCKRSSWNQHLATRKHSNATNAIFNATNATKKYAQESSLPKCNACGKCYKHFSSLYRHKKICSKYALFLENNENDENNENNENNENDENEIITMTKKEFNLAMENRELKGKITAYETGILPDAVTTAITSNINSNNTQNINIQLHLQEKFSSAINFSQLIEDISVSLKELQYTSEHGYLEGVSNIMIKAVNDCDENSRPIHHIPNHPDKTQQGLYIKDCDEWSKDVDGKFEKGIDSITQKHIDALKDWEVANPGWYNTDGGQQTYNSMVAEITNGVAKTREKIKKLITRQVHLPVTNNDTNTNIKI